ncbi:MAG: hypothetical protein CMF51_02700 [Legionellales bacterium]|nr:hypothetical protein [Legionellales bacterium]|tara:strand:+ start:559 stop:891 length:333 start_codon:yes stop_codon:yes gene_type:complete
MPTTNPTSLTQDLLAETGENSYFSLEGQPVQVQASSLAMDGSSPAVADGADPSMTMDEFLAFVGLEGASALADHVVSPAGKTCPDAPMKQEQPSRNMGRLNPRTLFNQTP